MRARSPFFARSRRDVLAIAASVPAGCLLTFAEIGAQRDVMPWHRPAKAHGVPRQPRPRRRG